MKILKTLGIVFDAWNFVQQLITGEGNNVKKLKFKQQKSEVFIRKIPMPSFNVVKIFI